MKINLLEIEAKEALINCLQNVRFLEVQRVEAGTNDLQPDLSLTLRVGEELQVVIVEIKNSGEPRFARQAVNQITLYLKEFGVDYGIFAAPYISPQAAAICKEKNVGTIDLAGNCQIEFDNIYIQKEGMPNRYKRKRYLRKLFSPKAERVLRVLLTSGAKRWKMEELAREAAVSLGQAANVKKLLADQEWIEEKTVGFSLKEPLALIEEWSKNYNYRRNDVQRFYTLLGIPEFEYRLGEVLRREKISYGLTGFSGSARYAPAVRYQRAMAYVQSDADELSEALGIKKVTSGENVMLLKPYDEGVFYEAAERDGLVVVSPVQIYLALYSYRGRGEEAAEVLLEEVIKKLW